MIFDPLFAITALERHRVHYLLIGGLAAVSQGSPIVTNDLDICYDRRPENLERLVGALQELGARLRGPNLLDDLPFELHVDTLRNGESFTFDTEAGPLDILATPSGSRGYDDLSSRAITIDLGGHEVLAASVEDLIAMKKASARPKDQAHVMHLDALREEIEVTRKKEG